MEKMIRQKIPPKFLFEFGEEEFIICRHLYEICDDLEFITFKYFEQSDTSIFSLQFTDAIINRAVDHKNKLTILYVSFCVDVKPDISAEIINMFYTTECFSIFDGIQICENFYLDIVEKKMVFGDEANKLAKKINRAEMYEQFEQTNFFDRILISMNENEAFEN